MKTKLRLKSIIYFLVSVFFFSFSLVSSCVNNTYYVWENTTVYNQTDDYNITVFDFSALDITNITDVLNVTGSPLCYLTDSRLAINSSGYNTVEWNILSIDSYAPYEECSFNETWDNTDYDNRRNITIDSTYIDSDLTNFTHYFYSNLTLVPSDYACKDYEFYDSDGHVLDFEIENSNATACDIWFRLDETDADDDTVVYVYYNNNTAVGDNENALGVWDLDIWTGVWHLNTDFEDSTINNYDLTNDGTDDVSSIIAHGREFLVVNTDNLSGSAGLLNAIQSMEEITVLGIEKQDDTTGAQAISTFRGLGSSQVKFFIYKNSGNTFGFYTSSAGAGLNLGTYDGGYGDGDFHFFAGSIDYVSKDYDLTIDGVSRISGNAPTIRSYDTFAIDSVTFGDNYVSQFYDGIMDELRISHLELSFDWKKAEYYSQSNQLNSLGDEETQSDGLNMLLITYAENDLTHINNYYEVILLDEETNDEWNMSLTQNETIWIECQDSNYIDELNDSTSYYITTEIPMFIRVDVNDTDGNEYYRTQVPTEPSETVYIYLLNLLEAGNVLVEINFELTDLTGLFGDAIIEVSRIIDGASRVVSSGIFDIEDKVIMYLQQDANYNIRITDLDDINSRSLGFLFIDEASTVPLTITEVSFNPAVTGVSSYVSWNYSCTTTNSSWGTLQLIYYDESEGTESIDVDFINSTDLEIINSLSSTSDYAVFSQIINNTNQTYIINFNATGNFTISESKIITCGAYGNETRMAYPLFDDVDNTKWICMLIFVVTAIAGGKAEVGLLSLLLISELSFFRWANWLTVQEVLYAFIVILGIFIAMNSRRNVKT